MFDSLLKYFSDPLIVVGTIINLIIVYSIFNGIFMYVFTKERKHFKAWRKLYINTSKG